MSTQDPLQPPNMHTSAQASARLCDKLLQSYLTLCDPMDCSPPGYSVHEILQARILGGLPFLSPGDLPDPGREPSSLMSPALAGRFFTTGPGVFILFFYAFRSMFIVFEMIHQVLSELQRVKGNPLVTNWQKVKGKTFFTTAWTTYSEIDLGLIQMT